MIILPGTSHTDHGLTLKHLEWLLALFRDRAAFFLETVELPPDLAPLECGLFGPLMGDKPVAEDDVFYQRRGNRPGDSRLVLRRPRPTRLVTVIAGPILGHACVLYTAFGGPASPREPFDPDLLQAGKAAQEKSAAFWKEHALAFTMTKGVQSTTFTDNRLELHPDLKRKVMGIVTTAEKALLAALLEGLPPATLFIDDAPEYDAPVRGAKMVNWLRDMIDFGNDDWNEAQLLRLAFSGDGLWDTRLAEARSLLEDTASLLTEKS